MTEPDKQQTSSDERAVGWGDDFEDDRADADERLRAERPPHHDRD